MDIMSAEDRFDPRQGIGYLADGTLFITGRKKDLIIRAGHNLIPSVIEEVVSAVAGVRGGGVAAFCERRRRCGWRGRAAAAGERECAQEQRTSSPHLTPV